MVMRVVEEAFAASVRKHFGFEHHLRTRDARRTGLRRPRVLRGCARPRARGRAAVRYSRGRVSRARSAAAGRVLLCATHEYGVAFESTSETIAFGERVLFFVPAEPIPGGACEAQAAETVPAAA